MGPRHQTYLRPRTVQAKPVTTSGMPAPLCTFRSARPLPGHGKRPQPPATRTGRRRRGPSCRIPRQRHAVANEFLLTWSGPHFDDVNAVAACGHSGRPDKNEPPCPKRPGRLNGKVMGGFDSHLAVRGGATEQDDMAPARAALWLLMPAPRRVVSIGYELAAAGVIRAAATRRACSAGPGVPCCLVRKMWCSVPVRVSASVSVSALAAILPSFCSASR
jgi:hypothetical protein